MVNKKDKVDKEAEIELLIKGFLDNLSNKLKVLAYGNYSKVAIKQRLSEILRAIEEIREKGK